MYYSKVTSKASLQGQRLRSRIAHLSISHATQKPRQTRRLCTTYRQREESTSPSTLPAGQAFPVTLWLCRMSEMIEIQDCIEDQRVAPYRFAAVHRVICEQEYIAVAQVRIHDDGMFRDRALVTQQT